MAAKFKVFMDEQGYENTVPKDIIGSVIKKSLKREESQILFGGN